MIKLYYKEEKAVLKNFEKDLDKCSRCALCQSVCPIYDVLKTESAVSRGKFLQLLGVIRGDLDLSPKIIQNLDICLNCGACKDFCPSEINAEEIFSHTYEEYLNKKPLLKILNSYWLFKLKTLAFRHFTLFNKKSDNEKILFFKGCLSKDNFLGVKDGGFKCCGLPFLTKGRRDIYEKLKRHNVKRAKNAQTVLFDCASCLNSFKNYGTDKNLVLISDLLKGELELKKPAAVMYHHPCHLKSAGISKEKIESFLTGIKNLRLIPTKSSCCGFSGDFFLRHPRLTKKVNEKCAKNYTEKADFILTSCPTCLWGLKFANTGKRVQSLDEFLAKNLKIAQNGIFNGVKMVNCENNRH